MIRFLITILFFLASVASLCSQTPAEADQKFIHNIEPFGLVIIEKITPGVTLYGLSRRYQIPVSAILEVNPDLRPEVMPIGLPVNIPIARTAIAFNPPDQGFDSLPIFYRVEPKETLYRIARVYLATSQENIIALNPRVKDGLSIGQVIHLGWYVPVKKETDTLSGSHHIPDSIAALPLNFSETYQNEGLVLREQKGLAIWKPGQLQTQYYVLHATAKPGTYMEITNPMLHRTISAKVAGNIPEGIYPARVGLVVSPSIAKALGVIDQQFYAHWRFVE